MEAHITLLYNSLFPFFISIFPLLILFPFTVAQIEAVEWPFDNTNNGKGARPSNVQNIAALLLDKKMDLVINLPMHIRPGTMTTNGYQIRRMAVEYSVPLIHDIKCAKLFVKVCNDDNAGWAPVSHTCTHSMKYGSCKTKSLSSISFPSYNLNTQVLSK